MEGGYGARVYDRIYRWKDYDAEVRRLREILTQESRSHGSLLDVACGTGQHLRRLGDTYEVQGLELDPEMAAIARSHDLTVAEGDMETFDLNRTFDVVTCLFSSIGYMESPDRLNRALSNFARHLNYGGVLLVEPWFAPEEWSEGYLHMDSVDEDDIKICRMSVSRTDGPVSLLDLHHMVAMPDGVEFFVTHHRMGLFADWEYREAFTSAGLSVRRDDEGLMGRGLYIGRKS